MCVSVCMFVCMDVHLCMSRLNSNSNSNRKVSTKSSMTLYEYEKTLMPFILLSKKRYVGMLYEDDPNKGKLKYMGLVLKRRDNCDLLKDVYGGVLDILMKDSNIENSIKFLNNCLEDLIQGKIHMDKLAITKASLRIYIHTYMHTYMYNASFYVLNAAIAMSCCSCSCSCSCRNKDAASHEMY